MKFFLQILNIALSEENISQEINQQDPNENICNFWNWPKALQTQALTAVTKWTTLKIAQLLLNTQNSFHILQNPLKRKWKLPLHPTKNGLMSKRES